MNRRELRTRGRAWPSAIARALARSHVTPNQVSVASLLFAAFAAFAFYRAGKFGPPPEWFVAAVVGIQLRLACNLLDGLLAIEGGLKSKTGDLYNEIPDRAADILILVGAGTALPSLAWGLALGGTAALFAVLTAYVRLLGGSLGLRQDFVGPMAKQHRMFTLSMGSLVAAMEYTVRGSVIALWVALALIAVGSAVTCARRIFRIAQGLQAR